MATIPERSAKAHTPPEMNPDNRKGQSLGGRQIRNAMINPPGIQIDVISAGRTNNACDAA